MSEGSSGGASIAKIPGGDYEPLDYKVGSHFHLNLDDDNAKTTPSASTTQLGGHSGRPFTDCSVPVTLMVPSGSRWSGTLRCFGGIFGIGIKRLGHYGASSFV